MHMFDNQPMIDETLLLLTLTDQSQASFGQQGNPLMAIRYDLDENWYGPLCQVFARVYRYDVWHRVNRIGVAAANREILDIAGTYRPKYVLWPALCKFTVAEETLLTLRKMGCIVVGRLLDDDTRFDIYSKWLIPSLDYCVTHVPALLPEYAAFGGRAVCLQIEGHNEGIYQKLSHLPKLYDVSFIGDVYPSRQDYLRTLAQQGISIKVFNNRNVTDRLTLRDMIKVINQSKINLNFTMDSAGLGNRCINGRLFEAPLCGGFLLTENAPDLARYFEMGQEIVGFDSLTEAAIKICYFLEHPEEREEIAARGYARAQRDYTSRELFRKVFLEIEEDLHKRGRSMPEERSSGVNPMRRTAAERHYKWVQFILRTRSPLRNTWCESVEMILLADPEHKGARRLLKAYKRWGDPEGPFVRLVNGLSSVGSKFTYGIYCQARRGQWVRQLYEYSMRSAVMRWIYARTLWKIQGKSRDGVASSFAGW